MVTEEAEQNGDHILPCCRLATQVLLEGMNEGWRMTTLLMAVLERLASAPLCDLGPRRGHVQGGRVGREAA